MAPFVTRARAHAGMFLFAVLLLWSPIGCTDSPAIEETVADGEELPILRQISKVHSHETRPMQLVIRDEAALAKVPLERIPVDFEHEMMLVVTLGRTPSDAYQVRIDRVYRDGGALRVDAIVEKPPGVSPLAPASPYCIAIVPRSNLNVLNFTADPPTRERTWSQSEPEFGR